MENKALGRYLVAVRDVKAGEIIMQEKPLLVTPPKITLPVCLGCYSEFRKDGAETDGMLVFLVCLRTKKMRVNENESRYLALNSMSFRLFM